MNKIRLYIKEAYTELLYKVTWPSWDELQNSAVVVLIASLIIAAVVLAMDQVSKYVLEMIYKTIIS